MNCLKKKNITTYEAQVSNYTEDALKSPRRKTWNFITRDKKWVALW